MNWKKTNLETIHNRIWKLVFISLFLTSIFYLMFGGPLLILLGICSSVWLFLTVINDFLNKLMNKTLASKKSI